MTTTSGILPNAIYSVHMSGQAGPTLALLIFQDGTITGADAGAAICDSTYRLTLDNQKIIGRVTVAIPRGVPNITTGLQTTGPFNSL